MEELAMDVPLYPSLWSLCITGCFVWPGLFIVFWSILSKKHPPYLACGTAMRLVSCAHAVWQFSLGAVAMSRTYMDVMFADCQLVNQIAAFATMYWLYDVVAMYMVYCRENKLMETTVSTSLRRFVRANPLICFHHFLVLAGGYPLTLHFRFGKAAFIVACVQFTEVSTPFLNFRKILIKHGNTASLLFRVNTGLAVITFFLARVVLFPSIYLIYAYTYKQTLWEVATSMYFGCHFAMFLITALQVVWFSIFTISLLKDRKLKLIRNGHQNGHHNGHHNGHSSEQNGHQIGNEVGYPDNKKSD